MDTDLADALFNVACYDSLQMKDRADPGSRARLEQHGINAMRESIAINAENLKDFGTDGDLKWLRESDSGRRLSSEAGVAPGAPPSPDVGQVSR